VFTSDALCVRRHGGSGGDGVTVGATVTGGSSYGSVILPALPGSSGGGVGGVSPHTVYFNLCMLLTLLVIDAEDVHKEVVYHLYGIKQCTRAHTVHLQLIDVQQ
jgi:hypothetical protein